MYEVFILQLSIDKDDCYISVLLAKSAAVPREQAPAPPRGPVPPKMQTTCVQIICNVKYF